MERERERESIFYIDDIVYKVFFGIIKNQLTVARKLSPETAPISRASASKKYAGNAGNVLPLNFYINF